VDVQKRSSSYEFQITVAGITGGGTRQIRVSEGLKKADDLGWINAAVELATLYHQGKSRVKLAETLLKANALNFNRSTDDQGLDGAGETMKMAIKSLATMKAEPMLMFALNCSLFTPLPKPYMPGPGNEEDISQCGIDLVALFADQIRHIPNWRPKDFMPVVISLISMGAPIDLGDHERSSTDTSQTDLEMTAENSAESGQVNVGADQGEDGGEHITRAQGSVHLLDSHAHLHGDTFLCTWSEHIYQWTQNKQIHWLARLHDSLCVNIEEAPRSKPEEFGLCPYSVDIMADTNPVVGRIYERVENVFPTEEVCCPNYEQKNGMLYAKKQFRNGQTICFVDASVYQMVPGENKIKVSDRNGEYSVDLERLNWMSPDPNNNDNHASIQLGLIDRGPIVYVHLRERDGSSFTDYCVAIYGLPRLLSDSDTPNVRFETFTFWSDRCINTPHPQQVYLALVATVDIDRFDRLCIDWNAIQPPFAPQCIPFDACLRTQGMSFEQYLMGIVE